MKNTSRRPIRLLIADDHEIVREGFKTVLSAEPGLSVVGEASDGVEAVRLGGELRPDVALMDIRMPVLSGMEATRELRRSVPNLRVIGVSVYEDVELVRAVVRAGARGYVLKDVAPQELFRAIERVHAGELYFSERVSQVIYEEYAQGDSASPMDAGVLSRREREVVGLVAEGCANTEIAERLGISRRTVETHRANIMSKLGLRNTAALVRYAINAGIAET